MTHSGGRKTYLTCPHRQTAVFLKCIGLASISYPRQHWLRHNQRGPCTSAYLGLGLDTVDLYLHQASNKILPLTIFFGRYPLSLRGRGPCSATRDSADFLDSRVCMVTRLCILIQCPKMSRHSVKIGRGCPCAMLSITFLDRAHANTEKKKLFRPSRPTENLGWPTHKKKCTVARQNVPGHSALLPPNYIAAKSPDVCSIIGTHALESRAHELIRDARRSKH